jgi:hypothetical protein
MTNISRKRSLENDSNQISLLSNKKPNNLLNFSETGNLNSYQLVNSMVGSLGNRSLVAEKERTKLLLSKYFKKRPKIQSQQQQQQQDKDISIDITSRTNDSSMVTTNQKQNLSTSSSCSSSSSSCSSLASSANSFSRNNFVAFVDTSPFCLKNNVVSPPTIVPKRISPIKPIFMNENNFPKNIQPSERILPVIPTHIVNNTKLSSKISETVQQNCTFLLNRRTT